MALPNDCATPVPTCCDTLFDMVEPLVIAAADAVGDCLGPALCPDEFPRYVAHGEPAGPGDYVAGWLGELRPRPNSRAANPAIKQFLPHTGFLLEVIVRLVESGHPTLSTGGSQITLPGAEALNYASMHSYSHAQRALSAMLGVTNAICKACNCESLTLASMRPDGPLAGNPPEASADVGWTWRWAATWIP